MFIKSSICGVLTLLSTTSAFALTCVNDYGGTTSCASSSSKAGDCETLGFSKDDVSGCDHFLYCPFDTTYKRCVTAGGGLDCSDYPLNACPPEADGACSICGNSKDIYYKANACIEGYLLTDGKCPANPCDGFGISGSCPTGGDCSSCKSGTSYKYKLNSCKNGYTMADTKDKCSANACTDYPLTACTDAEHIAKKSDGTYDCSSCLSGTTTKYKANSCVEGYVLSNNQCAADACDGYSLTSEPQNAQYDTCLSGDTLKYKITSCNSGYILSDDGTSCEVNPCDGYSSTKPENAEYDTCWSGDTPKYKITKCYDEYKQSGNTCICAKTCPNPGYIAPANGYVTYDTCVACGVEYKVSTGWACNEGYTKSGSSCVCAKTCKDKVSVPANATAVTENCDECGKNVKIVVDWNCNSGYSKVGDKCQEIQVAPDPCDDRDTYPYKCTGPTGTKCFKDNPCSGTAPCEWSCESVVDGPSIITPGGSVSVGGGGNSCSEECQPSKENSCECKKCRDKNYCVTGKGSGGMDPMCCLTDTTEGSTDTGISVANP